MRYSEFYIPTYLIEQELLEARIDVLREKYLPVIQSKLEALRIPPDIRQELLTDNELDAAKIFDWVVDKDPTNNKQYTQWLLDRVLRKKQPIPFEDVQYAPEIFTRYEEMKKDRTLPAEARDIGRLKTLSELQAAMRTGEEQVQRASGAEEAKARNESEILQDSNGWLVLIPKTEYAAQYWGRPTEWCTAWGDKKGRYPTRECRYKYYSEKGNIYIYINKSDTGERYQIQPATDQYMNVDDIDFDWVKFIEDNPELKDVSVKIVEKEYEKSPSLTALAVKFGLADLKDEEVQLNLVEHNPWDIKMIFDAGITPTEDVQNLAVEKNGNIITELLKNNIKPSLMAQRFAVEYDPELLIDLFAYGVTPDKEFQLDAISRRPTLIYHMLKMDIIPDEDVQYAAVYVDPHILGGLVRKGIVPSEYTQLTAVEKDENTIVPLINAGIDVSEQVQRAAVFWDKEDDSRVSRRALLRILDGFNDGTIKKLDTKVEEVLKSRGVL